MAHAPVPIAGRVAIPRSLVQTALRGLRAASRSAQSADASPAAQLDSALRHAAAFQRRCIERCAAGDASALCAAPLTPRDGPDTAMTLYSLMQRGPTPHTEHSRMGRGVQEEQQQQQEREEEEEKKRNSDGKAERELSKEQQAEATHAERQQARMHATLQQWITYTAARVPRDAFTARQPHVADALLHTVPRVVPARSRAPFAAAALEQSVRCRGAQAYVDLLVSHSAAPRDAAEWQALCTLLSVEKRRNTHTKKEKEKEGISADKSVPSAEPIAVMSLPLRGPAHVNGSWERSVAILSWAFHFQSMAPAPRPHISSADISRVLQEYVQHCGERRGPSGTDPLTAALQRQWREARAAEQQSRRLAIAARVDRTSASSLRVEGRRAAAHVLSDALCVELLLQGKWEEVRQHVRDMAVRVTGHTRRAGVGAVPAGTNDLTAGPRHDVAILVDKDKDKEKEKDKGTGDEHAMLALLFNRRRPIWLRGKLMAHARAESSPPQVFLNAPETPREAEALRRPLTPGLALQPRSAAPSHAKQEKHAGPLLLAELRRRVFVLSRLPRRVPGSLVRFEGRGRAALPYIRRCPAKEWAPWLLLAAVAQAAQAAKGHITQKEKEKAAGEILRGVRGQLLGTLFTPVRSYAAFHEHCVSLLVAVGSLLAPPPLLRDAVRIVLRPPSPQQFYRALPHHVSAEDACEKLWSRRGTPENKEAVGEIEKEQKEKEEEENKKEEEEGAEDEVRRFAAAKAVSLRNYHVSGWLEATAQVETLEGLVAALAAEVRAYGPPLFSPEAAAALLTAIVVHLHRANPADPLDVTETAAVATLQALGPLYFAVPANRAFGAAAYFKGVYSDAFVRTPGAGDWEWTAAWASPAALLVGRSLRLTSKYPTSVTETFFRIDGRSRRHPTVRYNVPPLRLRLMCMDPLAAVRYFDSQASQPLVPAPLSAEAPAVLARGLPFGLVAVNKPAGTSTTLHAGFPHLIGFLRSHVPWAARGEAPVHFQRGLVNRIDVGTSGIVLVADTAAGLAAARRASLVDRRVAKTYRALLLHCPPTPARQLRGEGCWYIGPAGSITRDVLADGSDLARLRWDNNNNNNDDEGGESVGPPASRDEQRPATTAFRVLAHFPASGVYDVEVTLLSGRRHQIRQHFAQLWHPLLGDKRYSARAAAVGEGLGITRPALHACRVTITPGNDQNGEEDTDGTDGNAAEKTVIECPLPEDMRRALQLLQEREKKY